METKQLLDEFIEGIAIEYQNNYLTTDKMAEDLGISQDLLIDILMEAQERRNKCKN